MVVSLKRTYVNQLHARAQRMSKGVSWMYGKRGKGLKASTSGGVCRSEAAPIWALGSSVGRVVPNGGIPQAEYNSINIPSVS